MTATIKQRSAPHNQRRTHGLVPTPFLPELPAAGTDRVRARAYEIYLARNGNGAVADAVSDWLQAERELNGSAAAPTAATPLDLEHKARGERLLSSDD